MTTWDATTADALAWFTTATIPTEFPIRLGPGEVATDVPTFLANLAAEIELGPSGPAAARVTRHLLPLRELFDPDHRGWSTCCRAALTLDASWVVRCVRCNRRHEPASTDQEKNPCDSAKPSRPRSSRRPTSSGAGSTR